MDATMPKRKRAPGGGRKRLGQSLARNLTIRIDEEMRERLEASAAKRAEWKRNWNLSQEILFRLRCSLDKEREHQRSQPMRDLCWLISDMAKRELYTDLPEQQSWHHDPFTFRAFKVAVTKLLDRLEPNGEMRRPRIFEGPAVGRLNAEALGEYAADKELIALEHAGERTKEETAEFFRIGTSINNIDVSPPLTIDEFEHELNAFPRIRRTFGIEEPGEDY
jgi:hypothetical protein